MILQSYMASVTFFNILSILNNADKISVIFTRPNLVV